MEGRLTSGERLDEQEVRDRITRAIDGLDMEDMAAVHNIVAQSKIGYDLDTGDFVVESEEDADPVVVVTEHFSCRK